MPLSFVHNVKTGFNPWWSITHLVTPAQKKGSLRKDRNWYFLSLSPHPEAPEPLLTPSPLPHQSTSARAPQHWPCHPKSQHPYPAPIPTQAAPISPKDRGSPKTPLARIQVWPYPGIAGRQPGGLHRPAGDSACGHHLRQDGSVIVLLVIVRMPGTEARMSTILQEPSWRGVKGTTVRIWVIPPRTWSPHEAAPLSSATPPSGNWGDTWEVRC